MAEQSDYAMEEIAPDIAQLRIGFVNVFLVGAPGGEAPWALVDAGLAMGTAGVALLVGFDDVSTLPGAGIAIAAGLAGIAKVVLGLQRPRRSRRLRGVSLQPPLWRARRFRDQVGGRANGGGTHAVRISHAGRLGRDPGRSCRRG